MSGAERPPNRRKLRRQFTQAQSSTMRRVGSTNMERVHSESVPRDLGSSRERKGLVGVRQEKPTSTQTDLKVYVAIKDPRLGVEIAERIVKSYKREDHSVVLLKGANEDLASTSARFRSKGKEPMVFRMKKRGELDDLMRWMVLYDKNQTGPAEGETVIVSPLRGLEEFFPRPYHNIRKRQSRTLERMGRRHYRRVRGITEVENPLRTFMATHPKAFGRLRSRQLEYIKVVGGTRALLQMLYHRHMEEMEDDVMDYLVRVSCTGSYTAADLPVSVEALVSDLTQDSHDVSSSRAYSRSFSGESSDPAGGGPEGSGDASQPKAAALLAPLIASPIESSHGCLLDSPGEEIARLILGGEGGLADLYRNTSDRTTTARGRRAYKDDKRATRLLSPGAAPGRGGRRATAGASPRTLQGRAAAVIEKVRHFNPDHLLIFDEPPIYTSPNGACLCKADYHGTMVVAKQLPEEVHLDFIRELETLSELNHPNIVGFLGAIFSPNAVMLLEYCENGSLNSMLQHKPEKCSLPVLRSVMEDVARGLAYMHTLQPPLIHRDIKSSNVLLMRDFTAKICDFGTTTVMHSKAKRTKGIGTVQWTAPEVFTRTDYTTKADVYSYGVLLWEMLSKSVPYDDVRFFFLIEEKVLKGQRPEVEPSWPSDLASLMQRCWSADPKDRPAMLKVLGRLRARRMGTDIGSERSSERNSEDSSNTLDSTEADVQVRRRLLRKASTRALLQETGARASAPAASLTRTLSDTDLKEFYSSSGSLSTSSNSKAPTRAHLYTSEELLGS